MDIEETVERNKCFDGIVEAFEKNTKYKVTKDGRHKVDCKKGLFGVSAPTKEQAMKEARHYFMQYFVDGEYNEGLRLHP
jgi:hypothetical protein